MIGHQLEIFFEKIEKTLSSVFERESFKFGPVFDNARLPSHESPTALYDPAYTALERYGVVILANVSSLSGKEIARLERYVRQGGALFLFLGDLVDLKHYNEEIFREGKGLLPARLLGIKGDSSRKTYERLHVTIPDHPAVEAFKPEEMRAYILDPRFYRRAKVAEEKKERGVAVIARFGGPTGDPAIVEKSFGRGRVLLFASSADAEWSTFPARMSYPIFIQEATTYLAQASSTRKSLVMGDPYESYLSPAQYAKEILLTTPVGDSIEKGLDKVRGERDRFRLYHGDTARAGLYELKFHTVLPSDKEEAKEPVRKTRLDYFAVNVEPEEGDLETFSEEELRDLLPGLDFGMIDPAEASLFGRAPSRGGGDSEYWRHFLGIMLGYLMVEMVLALFFGRYR